MHTHEMIRVHCKKINAIKPGEEIKKLFKIIENIQYLIITYNILWVFFFQILCSQRSIQKYFNNHFIPAFCIVVQRRGEPQVSYPCFYRASGVGSIPAIPDKQTKFFLCREAGANRSEHAVCSLCVPGSFSNETGCTSPFHHDGAIHPPSPSHTSCLSL